MVSRGQGIGSMIPGLESSVYNLGFKVEGPRI